MVAASVLNTVVSDYVFRTANRGSVRHTIPRLAAAELAPNEEDPRNHHKGSSSAGALYRDALSSVVFPIGNWRWSTWGPSRETPQELVLSTGRWWHLSITRWESGPPS